MLPKSGKWFDKVMTHLNQTEFGTLAKEYSDLRREIVKHQLAAFDLQISSIVNPSWPQGSSTAHYADLSLEMSMMEMYSPERTWQSPNASDGYSGWTSFGALYESTEDDGPVL